MIFTRLILNILLIIQIANLGVCFEINYNKRDTLAPESFFKQKFIKNNSNATFSIDLNKNLIINKIKLAAKIFINSYFSKLSISLAMITLFSSGVLFSQSSNFKPKIATDNQISEYSRSFSRKELGIHEKLPKRTYILNESIRNLRDGVIVVNDGWAMTKPGEDRSSLLLTVNVNDCVGLILYDKSSKTASLAHITRETQELGFKGLTESLDNIISSMNKNGANINNLNALMVGGHTGSSELLISFIEKYLDHNNVDDIKQDLGGNGDLDYLFDSETGEIYYFESNDQKINDLLRNEGVIDFEDPRHILDIIGKNVSDRYFKTKKVKSHVLEKEKVYRWGKGKTGKGLTFLGNKHQRILNQNQIKAYRDIFSAFEATANRRKLNEVQGLIENYKEIISTKDYQIFTSLVSLNISSNMDMDNRKLIFYSYFQDLLPSINVVKAVDFDNSTLVAYAS